MSVIDQVDAVIEVETPDDYFVWVISGGEVGQQVREVANVVCGDLIPSDTIGTIPVVRKEIFNSYSASMRGDTRTIRALYPKPQE